MINAGSFDELLNRAFQLAYFIHADKQTALRVAFDAAAKLEVAAVAQTKRLYYAPGKRSSPKDAGGDAARTKVFFSDRHLLQRLVYVESEKYEREREAGAIDEGQMLVHFIKHLVRVTIKRSSFYVALGASRVLHNYTTAETMEIYNVVVQDPDRAKDDYYYRSRKSRLMEELKERFDALVSTTQGQRGEERFTTATPAREDQACLAHEALRRFTPWNTPCSVPAGFDPLKDEIAELSTRKREDEDAVEVNRIHTALHPDCYERLTRALKLDAPFERLALPEFSLAKGADNMNGRHGERRRPFLSGDELQTIKDELSEQASRRKRSHATLLSVIVDGREQARLDPTRAGTVKLSVSDNAELIEVCAIEAGARTLLAAHVLDAEGVVENRSATKSEIVLESGQRICFVLSPNENASRLGEPLLLTVNYRETEASRAFALLRARARAFVVRSLGVTALGGRAGWAPAFGVILLIFCVSLFALVRRGGDQRPDALSAERARPTPQEAGNSSVVHPPPTSTQAMTVQPSSAEAKTRSDDSHPAEQPQLEVAGKTSPRGGKRTPSADVASRAARPAITDSPRRVRHAVIAQAEGEVIARTAPEPDRIQPAQGSVATTPSVREATRTLLPQTALRTMSEVKSVYIEAFNDQSFDQELSRSLGAHVQAGGRWVITGNANQADAALKLRVRQSPGESVGNRSKDMAGGAATTPASGSVRLTFTARLVNEDGKTLWQMSGAAKGSTRDQAIERVAAGAVGRMMKELRRADKTK
jgi:hypothetical protein